MARLALGIVGGVIGGLLGGPVGAQIGFTMGSILGSVLFPGKLPPGPRVNDLVVTTATNGAAIPIIYGQTRIAGNVIWATPLVENKSTHSVKGGPKQTTYSYTANFAVAFCEGPAAIRRIWFDSKVVYDSGIGPGPSASIGAIFQIAGVAIVGCSLNPPVGAVVTISGAPNGYNGTFTVLGGLFPPSATTFSYTVGDSGLPHGVGGLASLPGTGSGTITAISETGNVVTVSATLNPQIGDEVTIASAPSGYNGKFQVLLSSPVNFTYYNPTSGLSSGSGGTASVPAPIYAAPTLYTGSETQDADPTIQAAVGAANCPAFRGLCYAVWHNFPVANFGNRLPNVRAEVCSINNTSPQPGYVQSNNSTFTFPNGTGTVTAAFGNNNGAGNTILVFVAQNQPANGSVTGITDSNGNVYSQVGTVLDQVDSFSRHYKTSVYSAALVKGGANIITIHSTQPQAGNGGGVIILEYTGGIASSPVDAFDMAGVPNPNTAVTVNLATSLQNETIVLLFYDNGISGATAPAGFTFRNTNGSEEVWDKNLSAATPTTAYTVTDSANIMMLWGIVLTNSLPTGTTKPYVVVEDVCQRCGLLPADIDVSNVSGILQTLGGYTISRPTPGANALKPLALAFFFDCVESGGVLKFILRGGPTASLTVPEADLGIVKDNAKLTEQIGMAQELPREVQVLFNDKALDYQQNKQHKRRHTRIVHTKQETVFELPMTIDATAARQIAEKALFLAYLERHPYDMNLWKALYMLYDPTDVIQFVYEGLTFQMRIVKASIGADFQVALMGVNENASSYLSALVGGSGTGVIPGQISKVSSTILFLLDIPLLRDVDSNPAGTGYYFAMSSVAPAHWPGASLQKSSDNVNFAEENNSNQAANYGTATTVLGAPRSAWGWDTVNTLTIAMTNGTLAGTTDIAVLNGANALLVGGEVIQYVNAVQNGNGTFTISRLLRGRRGTDTYCNTHGAAEIVIDLISPGVIRQIAAMTSYQILRYYRPVTAGADISLVPSQLFTDNGQDLMPYAPAQLSFTRDGSNNLTLNWIRRTRIGGDWLNGNGTVPLSEGTESYDVEIVNGTQVVRTFAALTSPTAPYTAAQQATDFGSALSLLSFNVYQNSAVIGRGFKGAYSQLTNQLVFTNVGVGGAFPGTVTNPNFAILGLYGDGTAYCELNTPNPSGGPAASQASITIQNAAAFASSTTLTLFIDYQVVQNDLNGSQAGPAWAISAGISFSFSVVDSGVLGAGPVARNTKSFSLNPGFNTGSVQVKVALESDTSTAGACKIRVFRAWLVRT